MMRAGYCHTTALSDPSNNQRGIDDQVKLNSTEALLIISVTGMSGNSIALTGTTFAVTFCQFGPITVPTVLVLATAHHSTVPE